MEFFWLMQFRRATMTRERKVTCKEWNINIDNDIKVQKLWRYCLEILPSFVIEHNFQSRRKH